MNLKQCRELMKGSFFPKSFTKKIDEFAWLDGLNMPMGAIQDIKILLKEATRKALLNEKKEMLKKWEKVSYYPYAKDIIKELEEEIKVLEGGKDENL